MSAGENTGCAADRVDARSTLSPGYYFLTLIFAVVAATELRVRPPGMPSFTLLELGIFPVGLCLIAEATMRPEIVDRLRELYRRNRPFAWYVAYAGLASVMGLSRSSETLQIYKDLLPGLILYVLVFLTAHSHGRILGLLGASLAGGGISILLGLSQALTGGPFVAELSEHVESKQDLSGNAAENVPTGIFSHPNALGVVLLPIAIFLICATWPGFGRQRRFSLFMLGVLAVTLYVLDSALVKGAIAWLAAGVVFLLLPRCLDRWRFRISLLIPVFGIVFLVWFSVRSVRPYLEGESDIQFGTMLSRIELWLGALEILIKDSFVMLFGGGGALMGEREVVTMEYGNAHNAWIDQALNFGAPALVLYLASFVVALRSFGHSLLGGCGPTRTVTLAAMAALMALLGENFFEPADRGVVFQAELFILFALAAIYRPAFLPPACTRSGFA